MIYASFIKLYASDDCPVNLLLDLCVILFIFCVIYSFELFVMCGDYWSEYGYMVDEYVVNIKTRFCLSSLDQNRLKKSSNSFQSSPHLHGNCGPFS